MTPSEAEDLAARALAVIDALDWMDVKTEHGGGDRVDADRERIASDLAGLRDHRDWGGYPPGLCHTCRNAEGTMAPWPCPDATRYAAGLRRTAALCGVEP